MSWRLNLDDFMAYWRETLIMGLKGTAGSLENMLVPAALVLFTPLVSSQGVFLIAATLVYILTVASEFGLRALQVPEAAQAAR